MESRQEENARKTKEDIAECREKLEEFNMGIDHQHSTGLKVLERGCKGLLHKEA